jgi:hypothetical protein
MHHQNEARRRIERFVIDDHARGQISRNGDALVAVFERDAVECHEACPDQLLHLPPRAVAEIGQQPVEPQMWRAFAHLRAS